MSVSPGLHNDQLSSCNAGLDDVNVSTTSSGLRKDTASQLPIRIDPKGETMAITTRVVRKGKAKASMA